MKLLTFTMLCN